MYVCTLCIQSQISALWREMDVQEAHVAQLQVAVEDAHAQQFKEELIQTQVNVCCPQ